MPVLRASAVLQIALLLSAVPAQYFISRWSGSSAAQRYHATTRWDQCAKNQLLFTASKFAKRGKTPLVGWMWMTQGNLLCELLDKVGLTRLRTVVAVFLSVLLIKRTFLVSDCFEYGENGENHTWMSLHGQTGQASRCPKPCECLRWMAFKWGLNLTWIIARSLGIWGSSYLHNLVSYSNPTHLKSDFWCFYGNTWVVFRDWWCVCFLKVSGWIGTGRSSGTRATSRGDHAFWQWPGILWRFVSIALLYWSIFNQPHVIQSVHILILIG